MIKRLFLAIFLLLLVPASVLAQATELFPVPPSNTNTFLGQKHDYTVVFRGNGEAVVSVRVALTNNNESELKSVELRLPDYIKASELLAFQVIRERTCFRYAQFQPSICEEYAEPDYFQPYGQNKYQKATVEVVGDTLKVTLPTAILKEKSGAFFVYMRANGFAKKDVFGAYNFDFETLKVNESIQNLQVGISTDSDLILKGVKGEVDYRFDESAVSRLSTAPAGEAAVANSTIDNFYNQIGYGSINKTASGLAALESYKVSGAYAKTRLMLYAKEVVFGTFVFLILALTIFVAARLILRRGRSVETATKVSNSKEVSPRTFLWAFLTSIASAVLVALYTIALLFIVRLLDNSYYYGIQNSQTFIWLIIIVISFAIYAFLVFAPAILMGLKRGVGWGFATLGLTILWLVLLVFVVGLVIFLGGIGRGVEPPVPYLLEGGISPQKALE